MATLQPPFERLTSGATYTLQAELFGWRNVGSCTVTESTPFRFAASGSYDVMGRRGSFDLTLTLSDEDPAATTGPCTVAAMGRTETGTYTRTADGITFEGGGQHVIASAERDGSGVLLAMRGLPKIRIAP